MRATSAALATMDLLDTGGEPDVLPSLSPANDSWPHPAGGPVLNGDGYATQLVEQQAAVPEHRSPQLEADVEPELREDGFVRPVRATENAGRASPAPEREDRAVASKPTDRGRKRASAPRQDAPKGADGFECLQIEHEGALVRIDATLWGTSWLQRLRDVFAYLHLKGSMPPAAVVVKGVPLTPNLSALLHRNFWGAQACASRSTVVDVHDLTREKVVRMSLQTWYRIRNGKSPGQPELAADLSMTEWRAIAHERNKVLYLSAFEAQTHAPNIAKEFNAVADALCMVGDLPKAATWEQNFGPIIMDADSGASSGWHCDGTASSDGFSNAGDVNAVHWHIKGRKRWQVYAPGANGAVRSALSTHAEAVTRNSFRNFIFPQEVEDDIRAQGWERVDFETAGGDLVLVGKYTWHSVDTLEKSISVTADRVLRDQLDLLPATLKSCADKPLLPSKWAVNRLAAMLAGQILYLRPKQEEHELALAQLKDARAMLDALEADELRDEESARDVRADGQADDWHCVSCDRPHSAVRYCHVCSAEVYNRYFECTDEECELEWCPACVPAPHVTGEGGHVHAPKLRLLHWTVQELKEQRKAVEKALNSHRDK